MPQLESTSHIISSLNSVNESDQQQEIDSIEPATHASENSDDVPMVEASQETQTTSDSIDNSLFHFELPKPQFPPEEEEIQSYEQTPEPSPTKLIRPEFDLVSPPLITTHPTQHSNPSQSISRPEQPRRNQTPTSPGHSNLKNISSDHHNRSRHLSPHQMQNVRDRPSSSISSKANQPMMIRPRPESISFRATGNMNSQNRSTPGSSNSRMSTPQNLSRNESSSTSRLGPGSLQPTQSSQDVNISQSRRPTSRPSCVSTGSSTSQALNLPSRPASRQRIPGDHSASTSSSSLSRPTSSALKTSTSLSRPDSRSNVRPDSRSNVRPDSRSTVQNQVTPIRPVSRSHSRPQSQRQTQPQSQSQSQITLPHSTPQRRLSSGLSPVQHRPNQSVTTHPSSTHGIPMSAENLEQETRATNTASRPVSKPTSPYPFHGSSRPVPYTISRDTTNAFSATSPNSSSKAFGYTGHPTAPKIIVTDKPTSPLPRVAMLSSSTHLRAYQKAILTTSNSPLYPQPIEQHLTQSLRRSGSGSGSGSGPNSMSTGVSSTPSTPNTLASSQSFNTTSSRLPRVAQLSTKVQERGANARAQMRHAQTLSVVPLENALSLRDNHQYIFEDDDGSLSVHKILFRLQQYIKEIALLKMRDIEPEFEPESESERSLEMPLGTNFGNGNHDETKNRNPENVASELSWTNPAEASSSHLPKAQFAVIVLSGALAPVNEGHIAAIECAKVALERDYGYTVLCAYLAPASDAHMRLKIINKTHHMPLEHRIKMCELAAQSSSYVDVCEYGWSSADRVADKIRSIMRSIVFSLPDVRDVLDENATFDVVQVCGSNTALKQRLFLRGNYLAISRGGSAEKLIKDVMVARRKQDIDGPAHRFLVLEPEYEDNELPDVPETNNSLIRDKLISPLKPKVREIEELGWLNIDVLKYIVKGLDRFGWLCHQ